MCGPVAQWIRHLTTNQGIPGSNPGGVGYFLESTGKDKNTWPNSLSAYFEKKNRLIKMIINQYRKSWVFFILVSNFSS